MLVEIKNQEEFDTLNELKDEAFQDPFFKYAFSDEYIPGKGLQEVCRDLIFVSKNGYGEIVGCFTATYCVRTNKVNCITMINFTKKPSAIYAKDMFDFVTKYIFEKLKAHKINWITIVGSEVEAFNDKFVKVLGGRIVGIYKDDVTNAAGELCDIKEYEVLRSDYLKKKYGDDF